jgi:hypothetical protein
MHGLPLVFGRPRWWLDLAGLAGRAGEGAGVAREPGDVGPVPGLDEVLLVELPVDLAAGDGEVGAFHEEVVLGVPHPVLPHRLRRVMLLGDLLRGKVGRRDVAVALADDGGGLAAADGVHEPVRVVVVDHVEEAPAAPWHPLHEASAEVVEGDSDLHDLVLGMLVAGAEEHDIVVVGEVAVGDGDAGGLGDDVDEAVLAVGEGEVVQPHVGGAEDGDAVAVGDGAPAEVVRRVADVAAVLVGGDDVVDVDVVDDDVVDELQRELRAVGDAHLHAAAVNGLVAADDELLLKRDDHGLGEGDPQRLDLDDAPPERAGARVHHVVVGAVRHHVELAGQPAGGVAPEPLGAPRQALPVRRPVLPAPPAPVDRVRRPARPAELRLPRRRPHHLPPRANVLLLDGSAFNSTLLRTW